jgi:nucleoside 2-deoxyribosyltransferase
MREAFGKSDIILPFDVPFNRTREPEKKAKNRQFYFDKIDQADVVIVYTKNHVGLGTALEVGYAIAHGKQLKFTHEPVEGQEGDELRGLLADHSAMILHGEKWGLWLEEQ